VSMQAPYGIDEVSALEALDHRCFWTGRATSLCLLMKRIYAIFPS
jgi:hypothetical protein